jgi:hypothetical protein
MNRLYRKTIIQLLTLASLLVVIAGCNLPRTDQDADTQEMNLIMTSAAQTASAQLTQLAIDSLAQQLTSLASTSTPAATATPQATGSGLIVASPTSAYATPTPVPCYAVQFIYDVTIADGTEMDPGQAFTKTWRLKNIGSCTWQSNTQLVFISGHAMNGLAAKDIGQVVSPGQTADVSIALNAPDGEGSYTGYYQLRSPDGVRFGLGAKLDVSFWVKINVASGSYEMDAAHPLDFDYNICAAKWSSTVGRVSCSASSVDFTNGSVRKTNSPKLEGGYQDDEGTIVVSPSSGSGGMIMGQFPKITIANGDHFQSMIGCMHQRPDCNVLFELQYLDASDTLHSLGSWSEKSEGQYTHIDVDLSALNGKSIALILKVQNNGDSKDDEVFWLSPRIVR